MVCCLLSVTGVLAGEAEHHQRGWLDRSTLLDGSDPKEALRSHGIVVDFSVTQFYQGLVSGTGSKRWEYGGKADAFITLDGHKLGLWRGLFVSVHQEGLWGEDVNNASGTLLTTNTALAFPRLGGYDRDTSVIVTQNFSDRLSLSVGKFNMLDIIAKTPLVGGGGVDTFMNLGLAAPVTGMTPPYLIGASLTIKTAPVLFNLFVYDPRNAQNWDVIEHPFQDGTTFLGSVTVPVRIAGRAGFHGVKAIYSTQDGFDLADVPQLALPPEAQGELGSKEDRWFFGYSFQQYLYQSPADPQQGWGLFGQITISDGNPNPLQRTGFIGIGGTSFLPTRSLDRWGIAYFRYDLSDDLQNGLDALGIRLRDEQGVEAYYNLAVTPWLRLTGNVQYVQPTREDRDDAIFVGFRSQTKF